jgi:hypothetical protein
MMDDFDRWVTLARAERVTGTKARTLQSWLDKGIIAKRTNPGGRTVLVDLDELRPRPKVDTSSTTT